MVFLFFFGRMMSRCAVVNVNGSFFGGTVIKASSRAAVKVQAGMYPHPVMPEASMCGHSRVGVQVGSVASVVPFFSSKLPLLGVFPSAGRPHLPTILDIFQLFPS